jgi:hypothetical protein
VGTAVGPVFKVTHDRKLRVPQGSVKGTVTVVVTGIV